MLTVFIGSSFDVDSQIGVSAIIIADKGKEKYTWAKGRQCTLNPEKKQRNDEQALGAAIKAIMSVPKGSALDIYSNNQYLVRVLSGEWEAKSNLNLIQKFVDERQERHIVTNLMWAQDFGFKDDLQKLCYEVTEMVRESGRSEVVESKNKCIEEDTDEKLF